MAQRTQEERLKTLEKRVAELEVLVGKLPQAGNWRSALGMFSGDEVMRRIDAAGRKIREADRERARNGKPGKPRKATR